jgi:nitroreductase
MMFMELDDAIKGRRSIRNYADKPVSIELVREVIRAATLAPSAKNGQHWRFTVLTDEAKNRLAKLFRSELEILSAKIGAIRMGSAFSSCRVMEQAPLLVIVWKAGENKVEEVAHALEAASLVDLKVRAQKLAHEAELQGVAAAIQNMLLKACSLGLGSLWICDIYWILDAILKYFGKPWYLVAVVALGWPTLMPKPRPRMTVDDVTEFLS